MPSSISRLDCATRIALAPAQTAAAPAQLEQAKANVFARGTFSQTAFGDTVGLADVRGPRDGNHTADYMNVWGAQDQQGNFHTSQITLVSENWQHQPDGTIRIDQWLHQLSEDGTQRRSMHNFIVETAAGRILQTGSTPFTDDEAAAHAAERIAHFSTFTPTASQSFRDQPVDPRVLRAIEAIAPCGTNGPQLRAPGAAGFSLRR